MQLSKAIYLNRLSLKHLRVFSLFYDAISVGSATIDFFSYSEDSELIQIKSRKSDTELIAYPLGSKISLSKTEHDLGGGGTNSAAVLSKLGFKTAFLGKIGDDFIGEEIVKLLKKYGINFIGETVKGERSAMSIILDSDAEDRTILAFKGISRKPISDLKDNDALLYYMTSPSKEGIKDYEKFVKEVHSKRAHVAFNPSSYIAQLGIKKLSKILKYTDILVLNFEEMQLLTNEYFEKKEKHFELKEAIRRVHSQGPYYIAVTNGSKLLTVSDGNYLYEAKPRKVKVAETTGAGDTFGATFSSLMVKNTPIEEAIDYALINSASVISYQGPKNRLLSIDQLKRVRKNVSKLQVTKKSL